MIIIYFILEQKNRKILEHLEEQKKRLRMGGHAGPPNPMAMR